MTIYKFPLDIIDVQTVTCAALICRCLTVQMQRGKPKLWALVNPDKQAEGSVVIRCYGTGGLGPLAGETYLGTVQDDRFVFHFFEGWAR